MSTLEEALRGGLWRRASIWAELASLVQRPEEYADLRALWWESPRKGHNNQTIICSIASAAAAVGEHDEARALLRKVILLRAQARRRMRARLGRTKRRVLTSLPYRGGPSVRANELAATALADVSRGIESVGAHGFLIAGTLLSLIRDGRLDGSGGPLALGFFAVEVEPTRLARILTQSHHFSVRRTGGGPDWLLVDHANRATIMLIPHYTADDGRIWCAGTGTRWRSSAFTLDAVSVSNLPLLIPDPTWPYLGENFGGLQVSLTRFDARLDAPNLEVTNKDALETSIYLALIESLTRNEAAKIRRYRGWLRDLGEGPWLDRI